MSTYSYCEKGYSNLSRKETHTTLKKVTEFVKDTAGLVLMSAVALAVVLFNASPYMNL